MNVDPITCPDCGDVAYFQGNTADDGTAWLCPAFHQTYLTTAND